MTKLWRLLLIGILLLTGCTSLGAASSPEPALPPVKADASIVLAEGAVEPARWVTLRAEDNSVVRSVVVAEGDAIAAGDVLLRFDDAHFQLAIDQAEATLAGVQAQLDLVRAGARPEEIAVLHAQLQAAHTVISQTTALLAVRQVEGAADVADAQATIAAADLTLHQADEAHDETMQCFDVPKPDGGTEKVCPALGTFEEITRAQMEAAQAALLAAQVQLTAIHEPAAARLVEAQACIQAAEAQRDGIQAQLALVQAGATSATLATAEAAVQQARTALDTAHDLLDARVLDAPFAGTVTDIALNPGGTVELGSHLVTLATLNRLHIRTTNLTELDISRVAIGQTVVVTFDVWPAQTFTGRVTRIDRQGTDYLGDIVFPVFVDLDAVPDWLRWGMTAEVRIESGEERKENGERRGQPVTSNQQPTTIFVAATLEPERWAALRFTLAGEVAEVLVEPGTQVAAGDLIARLDARYVETAVREAEAALATAQAQRAAAQTGPSPEAIAAAEASVAAAEGDVARAIAIRDQLSASVRQAQSAAVHAQLEAARAERREREAHLRWAEDDGDTARAQDVRAHIAVIDARLAAAQTHLDVIPRLFAAQVHAAETSVNVAEAQRNVAVAQLALAQAGPRAAAIAIAEAGVQQAQVALDTARLTLSHTELRAAFAGTVTQVLVAPGDLVSPERPIAMLATLDRLQACTRDLLESDVVYLVAGQSVRLTVDSLPGVPLPGTIKQIAAQGSLYRGDMTYPVTIALEGHTTALLWGMTALVEIDVEE